MKRCFICWLTAILALPLTLWGQGTPLLRLTTIHAGSGSPFQFTFSDQGTGATNYVIEFAPAVGGGVAWSNVTDAAIIPMENGEHYVAVPNAPSSIGFYRVRTLGGTPITASFASTAFQVTEGGSVSPMITFSAPLFGVVRYTVSGTAASGDYVNLSGEIFVNGTSATIPVTLRDNQSIGHLRYFTLTIEGGAGYQLRGGSQTTITIVENDAEWQGSFTTDAATLGFVLKIQEADGVKMATLKSDGFGIFPTNELPADLLFTPDQFVASISGISVPANATLLNEPMSLAFFLSATSGVTNQQVSAMQVQGVGTLISAVPGRPHLSTTNAGTFLLFKPPVKSSTNQVELVSAP